MKRHSVFSFLLVVFIIAYWRVLIMVVLKSLSDISIISVISVLSSINFLFLNSFWDLPDPWYNDWFSFEAWTFLYYAIKLWILFECSVSTGLFWHCSCKRVPCFATAKWWEESRLPTGFLSTLVVGRGSLLVISVQRWGETYGHSDPRNMLYLFSDH